MEDYYDAIYLSPHLDDVALSCGGQLYLQSRRGERVLVVTVAAGEPQTEVRSPFAEFLHHNWGFTAGEGVAMRRVEDVTACERLGATAFHWHLPDAIYRVDPASREPLYTSNEGIFGAVASVEKRLVDDVAAFLNALPRAGRVIGPLAIGNHVDHQLVRAAAERVWGRALLYYEDYPYVQRDPDALLRAIDPPASWRSYVVPLTPAALSARLAAMSAYESQLSSLFNDLSAMEADVLRQAARTGGERLWQKAGGPGARR